MGFERPGKPPGKCRPEITLAALDRRTASGRIEEEMPPGPGQDYWRAAKKAPRPPLGGANGERTDKKKDG